MPTDYLFPGKTYPELAFGFLHPPTGTVLLEGLALQPFKTVDAHRAQLLFFNMSPDTPSMQIGTVSGGNFSVIKEIGHEQDWGWFPKDFTWFDPGSYTIGVRPGGTRLRPEIRCHAEGGGRRVCNRGGLGEGARWQRPELLLMNTATGPWAVARVLPNP